MIEIKKQIENAAAQALAFYDQFNSEVGSDLDAADRFVKLVYEQLLQAATKEQLELFDESMQQIDSKFTKEDNLKATNKVFQEAEDTETIILHMISPVDLERRVFKKEFRKYQDKYINVAKGKLRDIAIHTKQKCQAFIELVLIEIEDKGESPENLTKVKKQDLLEYMFGCLIKDVTIQEHSQYFIDKKRDAERNQIFP